MALDINNDPLEGWLLAGAGAQGQIVDMVSPTADFARLVALPSAEGLALGQALWASLRADAGVVRLTAEARALVAQRRAEAAPTRNALVAWAGVCAELWADETARSGAADAG